MRSTSLLICGAVLAGPVAACYFKDMDAVFADIHDGDKKNVNIQAGTITIKPSGNNQTWTVIASIDTATCTAVVDFNVPGKPNPPPVNLTLSLFEALTPPGRDAASRATFEFFDPSGKIGPADTPLNTWIQLGTQSDRPGNGCPGSYGGSFKAVFSDMHDGDKKEVEIDGKSMTITPSGNTEKWTVNAAFSQETCSAVVDFNVPGKPNPPPVKLTLSLWNLFSDYKGFIQKVSFDFTDPSGKLAKPDFPLNTWVQLGSSRVLV